MAPAFIASLFFWAASQCVADYPANIKTVRYVSSADDTRQPALYWQPKSDQPVPLLVALHTWSSDYRQAGGEVVYVEWCQRVGWAFIHPDFRGANTKPAAMGSDLSVADIVSSVDFAKSKTRIDTDRIYCVGVSGGGHASLLMAARAPKIWAGVSAWCGISDIATWHGQCKGAKFTKYATHIEQALGGPPSESVHRKRDAMRRSPIEWLTKAKQLPAMDINHGIQDGRAGSVPFSHSLLAWNAAVEPTARLSEEAITQFYESQKVPASLVQKNIATADPQYGKNQPMYRQVAGNARITIFNGGHEIVHNAALNWLAAQRKGKPANWAPPELANINEAGQASGK